MAASPSSDASLPDKYVYFYSRLTEDQKALYEYCIADLESNPAFMAYADHYNHAPQDAHTDNMYGTVNYKMCLLRDAARLDALKLCNAGSKKEVILDIGCGTGYFAYFAQRFGHKVYGLDAPLETCGRKIFADGQRVLGLNVTAHTIQPFTPLPALPEPISLAVAFSPHFYSPSTDDFWRVDAWQFFMKDLARKMTEDGKIYFHMNKVISRPDFGVFGTRETHELFKKLGKIQYGYIVSITASDI